MAFINPSVDPWFTVYCYVCRDLSKRELLQTFQEDSTWLNRLRGKQWSVIAKISVYKHWRHFRSRGSKSLVRVVGRGAFEPVKSFAHRRNFQHDFRQVSNFLQTLTMKHFHNILTFFLVSEWNLAYMWSDSRLKYALNSVISFAFVAFCQPRILRYSPREYVTVTPDTDEEGTGEMYLVYKPTAGTKPDRFKATQVSRISTKHQNCIILKPCKRFIGALYEGKYVSFPLKYFKFPKL